jgi:hypothetical protein
MKFKLKNGMEIDLHDEDIKAIGKMADEEFDFEEMEEYFKDLHKHAIANLERISEMIITDENSIDLAAVNVMKNGTYMDFAKFMRYSRDYDIAKHLLESVK